MANIRRIILLSIPLFLLCALSTEAQQKRDTVRLSFNWPAGLVAHVEHHWMKIKTNPDASDTVQVRGTYRIQALHHPEGRLIRTDSFEIPDAANDKSLTRLEKLLRQAPALFPDYVVSPEGDFLHVENLEQTRSVFDSLFGDEIARLKGAAKMKAMFDSLLSPTSLTGIRAEEWNPIVGYWSSSQLIIGSVLEEDLQQPTPLIPGLVIPMKRYISARQRLNCNEEDTLRGCVKLQIVTQIDSAAFMTFLRALVKETEIEDGEEFIASVQNMKIDHVVTLITDPETLIPYSLSTLKYAEGEQKNPTSKKRQSHSQTESRTYTFNYE